jgi:hypothetical protein
MQLESFANAFHLDECDRSDAQNHCDDDPDEVGQVDVSARNV